jgi:hypothetical protein
MNKGEETCEFVLKSSDPANMIVKEKYVEIPAGMSGKLQLRFPPIHKNIEKVYYLNVDNKGKQWECFKFIVLYE